MKKQKVLSSETEYHLLPSNQETITLLAIAATNHDLPRLNALAKTINERYRASQDCDKATLDNALIMGSCFNEAKALKKDQIGEFGKWCRINCSVNDTQRRIYQRLDRNRDLIADQINTGVVSSIKSALRLISQISQKSKSGKKPTNKLIGRVTLPFSDIEVSKDSKDKKNPYYCLIFRTTKRQDVANTYKAITGNDLPPDPPDEEPAEKIESVEEPTELAELTVKSKSGQHGQHDYSFNFWIGCHKFSDGCQNCYMFIAQTRRNIDPENVRLCTTTWGGPLRVQEEAEQAGECRSVFACSYSDFFSPEADAWRNDAWALIRETPNLIWQLASKRTHLIAERLPADWGNGYKNVWLGTSAELNKYLSRLDELRNIPCVLRWLDLAPMLEDLMPELAEHIDGFGWVNAAGETGCNAVEPRPFDEQWARNVRDMCSSRGIPFYFSHTAGRKRHPPRLLDGVEHNGIPPLTTGL